MDSTANHGLQGCSAWLIRLQNAYAYGHITQGLLRLVVIQQSSKVLQFLSLGTLAKPLPRKHELHRPQRIASQHQLDQEYNRNSHAKAKVNSAASRFHEA
jgi:hypothetical protein